MFTSCCPAWVKYVEMKHPELIKNLSSTKSPNSIMGALVKSYFSEIKNIPKEKNNNCWNSSMYSKKI